MNEEARRARRVLSKMPGLKEELLDLLAKGSLPILEELGISPSVFEGALTGRKPRESANDGGGLESMRRQVAPLEKLTSGSLEAIIRLVGRPPLLVQNGTYQDPPTIALAKQLKPHRKRIEAVIASVGRIEFRFHPMPWAGSGWMIEDNILVTNRHVAELVAEADNVGGFQFKMSLAGRPFEARVNYRHEWQNDARLNARFARIKFIASLNQPDVALFEIEKSADFDLPAPIPLSSNKKAVEGLEIGVVGYPADDPDRNDPESIASYFGDIFDVKRFSSGEVTRPSDEGIFIHDATTLGGNSGSVVFELATGKAAGLHFAGEYKSGNYAVDAATLKKVLKGLKTVVRGSDLGAEERNDGRHKPDFFAGRDGYQSGFLGKAHSIPLPPLGRWEKDAAVATEHDGSETAVLRYRHFSVQFSRSRKLPIFTAVNINGERSRRIKRGDDQWFQDLRLPRELQLGKDDYARRVIDRGHMVRREDPVWGDEDEALQANFDTFHYTNAAPQHGDLNQRRDAWQGLENFILENSRTLGLKVSVFTGPVLRDDDPVDKDFPGLGRIPREFWKVIAAIDAKTKKLYATGFILSQGKMIADFTESIVFGGWSTYQVPIARIAKAARLSLTRLTAVDTMARKRKPGNESIASGARPILLNRVEDIFLG